MHQATPARTRPEEGIASGGPHTGEWNSHRLHPV